MLPGPPGGPHRTPTSAVLAGRSGVTCYTVAVGARVAGEPACDRVGERAGLAGAEPMGADAAWRVRVRQIGHDLGRGGMDDDEIVPLLHRLDRPTLFTRDRGFYDRALRQRSYCLVYLDVGASEVAAYVRVGRETANVGPRPTADIDNSAR
jgi:hypothetical protein